MWKEYNEKKLLFYLRWKIKGRHELHKCGENSNTDTRDECNIGYSSVLV